MRLLLLMLTMIQASIYKVSGPSHGWESTEKMFKTNDGPFGWNGNSLVTVDMSATLLLENAKSEDFGVAVVLYSDELVMDNLCTGEYDGNGSKRKGRLYTFENGTKNVHLKMEFDVKEEGIQKAIVQSCRREKGNEIFHEHVSGESVVGFEGQMRFRNPYGFLPGLLYGLLPFSGILAMAYGFLDVFFVFVLVRHRKMVLNVQYFMLLVLFLTTVETVSWYATYKEMNDLGNPVCCPYPNKFMFSTITKVLSQTVARELLLLISLGYGIVRPSISKSEVLLLLALGVCYATAGVVLEVNQAVKSALGDENPPMIWAILQILTNAVFATWIYSALMQTRENLQKAKQIAKYKMYDTLVKILIVYLLCSMLMLLLEGAVYVSYVLLFMYHAARYSHNINWSWKSLWIIAAGSRVLNFFIIFSMSFIWRPSPTAMLYAYSTQLPSEDNADVESNDNKVGSDEEIDIQLP